MEWTRGPMIGRGSSATVSLAGTSSGELFAVKSAELSRSSYLQREQVFLSQLNSPCIVHYLGFEITSTGNDKTLYNLFMEYVAGGTISEAMKKRGGSLDESLIRVYARDILLGLDYLHSNLIVHCDIKGQNVLVGRDSLKIADLGCARFAGECVGSSKFAGTPMFMSPEVARGEEQGFPADVWALGCTVIEMATGSPPWPEVTDPVSALHRIGFSGDSPEVPWRLSVNARDFLAKCLRQDPGDRWTAKQLLQHPFVANLESNFPKSDEFSLNSPSGVLDQGFWESQEAFEAPQVATRIHSYLNSPAERIGRLIGGSSESGLGLPVWSWDEDWITVRNSGIEEEDRAEGETKGVNLEEPSHDFVISEDLLTECSVFCIIDCFGPWTESILVCFNKDAFVHRIDDKVCETWILSSVQMLSRAVNSS
ncbi:Mitogen-activated protein kinase kinase kinase [Bertholletia excelsa]